MVNLKYVPMAEVKPPATNSTPTPSSTAPNSSSIPAVRKPARNIPHIHQYSCVHRPNCVFSENIEANGGPFAQFSFGPGFEPHSTHFCPGPSSRNNAEHVVMFHVHHGVTIFFRLGDSYEILRGPVTVPMVSTNSTPPMAMPVQVPPGHVLQQVVDENGTLRHVILSTQPPGLVPLPSHNPAHFGGGPGNSTNQAFYQSLAGGFPPGPHYHSNMAPGGHPAGPSPTHPGHSPPNPNYYKDERTQRQHNKLKKKFQDKQQNNNTTTTTPMSTTQQTKLLNSSGDTSTSCSSSNSSNCSSGIRKDLLTNGLRRDTAKEKDMNSVGTSEDGEESSIPDEEDSVQIIADILSTVQAPKVSELSSRSALLKWSQPTRLTQPPSSSPSSDPPPPDIDITSLRYEVLFSDKSKEMKFKSIYNGEFLSCRIRDLKPGQEYSVCLQVHYEELQGAATDPLKFTTPPCEPDQPQPPKLHQRNKTSLHLKWSAVNDNGSAIINYVLEYDEGKGGEFIEFYRSSGKVKQYTLHKLQPATGYKFRLAAINEIGKSAYSDVVTYSTSSNPPPKPDTPNLVEASVDRLHLAWTRRAPDEDYTLEMNDLISHYPILADSDSKARNTVSCICSPLHRFTEYRFRLKATNDGGQSPWSDPITYATLPDRPARPSKPLVKGRIHAHSFKLKWEAPNDSGGADITEYLLEVNSGRGYEPMYRGTDTEAICDKLNPGTTYQLRVCCQSAGGCSAYSDPCTVTTDAITPGVCGAPKLAAKPKAGAMALKWAEPDYNGGAPVLEYQLEMAAMGAHEREMVYKGREMGTEVGGLAPGTDYEFFVRAVNRVGASGWSDGLKVTSGAAAPGTPDAPVVECRSAVCLAIGWREPAMNGAPIAEYKLEMGTKDCDDEWHVIYQGNDVAYEVKGLCPFTTYYFRVQAANSAGWSGYSGLAATITPAAAPGAVLGLRADATATSIALNWSEPACNGAAITNYNIEFGDKSISTQSPSNEHLLDNLNPDTLYKIKVQACNDIGSGGFSSVLRIATLRLPPIAPKLECIGYGHNYLKLKWGDGKNLDYTQYMVEMEHPHSHEFHCVYKGTALNYKVNKLNELQTYRFRICATNDAGTGDYSMICEFDTLIAPPAAVKQPKIVEIEQRHCVIEWNQARNNFSDAIEYQVQLTRAKEQLFRDVYRGAEPRCALADLEPGTEYSARVLPIRVTSSNGDLAGPISPALGFATLADELSAMKAAQVTNATVVAASHHHHHRNRMNLGALLQLNRWKMYSNKPVFYAILVTIIGIIISIWITTFFF